MPLVRLELPPAVPAKDVRSHLPPSPIHSVGYGVEVLRPLLFASSNQITNLGWNCCA